MVGAAAQGAPRRGAANGRRVRHARRRSRKTSLRVREASAAWRRCAGPRAGGRRRRRRRLQWRRPLSPKVREEKGNFTRGGWRRVSAATASRSGRRRATSSSAGKIVPSSPSPHGAPAASTDHRRLAPLVGLRGDESDRASPRTAPAPTILARSQATSAKRTGSVVFVPSHRDPILNLDIYFEFDSFWCVFLFHGCPLDLRGHGATLSFSGGVDRSIRPRP